MAEWVGEARARSGELKKGSMEADDEEGVNTRLRSQQLTPTKVKKKGKGFSLGFGAGVSGKDLVTFTRLFATMIDAASETLTSSRCSRVRKSSWAVTLTS